MPPINSHSRPCSPAPDPHHEERPEEHQPGHHEHAEDGPDEASCGRRPDTLYHIPAHASVGMSQTNSTIVATAGTQPRPRSTAPRTAAARFRRPERASTGTPNKRRIACICPRTISSCPARSSAAVRAPRCGGPPRSATPPPRRPATSASPAGNSRPAAWCPGRTASSRPGAAPSQPASAAPVSPHSNVRLSWCRLPSHSSGLRSSSRRRRACRIPASPSSRVRQRSCHRSESTQVVASRQARPVSRAAPPSISQPDVRPARATQNASGAAAYAGPGRRQQRARRAQRRHRPGRPARRCRRACLDQPRRHAPRSGTAESRSARRRCGPR